MILKGINMLYVDKEAVARYLTMELSLKLSEIAFKLQSERKVEQPLRNIVKGEDGSLMGTMPIYIKEGPYQGFGLKSVVVRFQSNGSKPSHVGSVLVYDEPGVSGMAVVDAGAITEIRTAAASAYATHLLAAKDASRLAILGTGLQARAHLQAMLYVRPIKEITLWGRSEERCREFATWCDKTLNLAISIKASPTEAVLNSDIICTTTASRDPIISRKELPAKCHINAIGASALGFQELNEDMYSNTTLFTDSNESVLAASQSVIKAREKGILSESATGIEIGTVHASLSGQGVTIFQSVGLAVQDMVFSREVIRQLIKMS
ncbi:Cro/Cl family transcriptional regulator [Photorhabdus khanii subsp. guanajuatensis]|uniref:Cro/Cl family transcriptional regulator n=2 Tax=Photorhabdus khanii TaxID=1004150 RepID=A0A4R4K316_9GAMM|nr:Cro/Cl family transcriptional regulator [Photorhabdus khanii subsp. guanajuatensis]